MKSSRPLAASFFPNLGAPPLLLTLGATLLWPVAGRAQTSLLFAADFESSLTPSIGSIDYNANGVTAVATLTAVTAAAAPDVTLGSQVLALESNDTSLLNARIELSEVADLTENSATITFDIAALRSNGASKTTLLSGVDSKGEKIFTFVLGDLNAFGNGSADRQRPGYEVAGPGRAVLPGPGSPAAFWWGSDATEVDFDASKDARFELTIASDSWTVSSTSQNGENFTSSSLPTFDNRSFDDLQALTLETTTGSNFGLYWDNISIFGVPASSLFVDSDMDGMDDGWEEANFHGSLSRDGSGDFEGDGVSDLAEFLAGSSPLLSDSDHDLLSDAQEINLHGTDPARSDSDGDSNPDGFEIAKGTDPQDAASRTEQPNIIFILADDLGYGDLGVLFQNGKSGKRQKTPFLDQMAADGMILDRHYCPAPVCAPSRGSLLTGLHQGHANVRNNQFDKALENNLNLANTLKTAGYSTNLIGKWGLQGGGGSPELWPAYPTKRGFDYFFGYVGHGDGHTHYPGHDTSNETNRGKKRLYEQDEQIQFDLPNGSNNLNLAFTPDLFTARAKKLIADEVNDGDQQPFFLYLAYDTPHAALQIPTTAYPGENNSNDLDDSGLGLTGGVQWIGTPGQIINTAIGTLDSYRHPDYTGNGWSNAEERFATLTRRMDDNIGDLRKTLADLGIADNTLIVLTSDNGPHNESYYPAFNYSPQSFQSYGPFEGQKRDCWEGGIREPSLVCWPDTIPAGSLTSLHSQFHDWMPTLCDIAHLDAPARTDGVSLLPTLTNPGTTTQATPTTYIEYSTGGTTPTWTDFGNHGGTTRSEAQVIFLDGYKGIRNNPSDENADFQIYNTVTDLDEGNDLRLTSDYFSELNERMKDRVLQIRQPDSSASRPYDAAPVPVPRDLPSLVLGTRYQTYSGIWPWIPEFRNLRSTSEGELETGLDLSVLTTTANDDGILFEGYLNIPATGTWNFAITSDSGAFLRIHDAIVLDDDFAHDGSEVSGTLILEAGFHPFRLYYKNRDGVPPSLDLQWSGPGTGKEEIPLSAFFVAGTPDPEPRAFDDSGTATATSLLANSTTIQPLANDIDDGLPQALTLSSFEQPAHGTVTRNGDELTYTPHLGFYGTDSFRYTITDGTFFASASITISTTFDAPDLWLPFNECHGETTSRATGVVVGTLATSTQRGLGKHGNGLSFDGVDSEFSLSGVTALPTGSAPRTVMAWVKAQPGAALENQTIFGYGANNNGQRFSLRLNSGNSNNLGTSNQRIRLEVQGGFIVGNQFVDDGDWHHIAVVSGADVEDTIIYLDGQLDTDASQPGFAPTAVGARAIDTAAGSIATLGGSNHSPSYTFLGEIDEFRLYPRVLSAAEIQSLASATQQVPAAWHRTHYGDAALTGWDDDSDHDGVTKLGEYAFGGDPRTPDSILTQPVCSFDSATGKLSLSFRRRSSAASQNLAYSVETSATLEEPWSQMASEANVAPLAQEDCFEWAEYLSDTSAPSTSRLFMRVRADLLPDTPN